MGAGGCDLAVLEEVDGVGVVQNQGEVVVTTVVRPLRASPSRTATVASVWASRAEVGSTARRISGSARRALARRTRWRWPPLRLRAWASMEVSRPWGRAWTMSCAAAVWSAFWSAASACPAGAGAWGVFAQFPAPLEEGPIISWREPANRSASWSATRMRDRIWSSAMSSRRVSPHVTPDGAYRPRRSTTAVASAEPSATRAVRRPGRTRTPDSGSYRADGSDGASRVPESAIGSRCRNRTTRRAHTRPRLIW